jgi:uncharacterized protein (TIGR02466 family)
MKKIELLPDFLYEFTADSVMVENTRKIVKDEKYLQNGLNFMSEDRFLFRKKLFSDLTKWVNGCLEQIRKDLSLRCEKLEVCLMWANKSGMGQSHRPHRHQNSWASGIFYLTESNAQTIFAKENFWIKDESLEVYLNEDKNLTFFQYKTLPGKMLIFPSSLTHGVDEHKSMDSRFTISFNAFPCGLIGNTEQSRALYIPPFSSTND